MASSKPLSLIILGTFYLPFLSLSLVMGFFLSLALPIALSLSISAMDSALFIFLPQLWHAFLSWITPPCLFVLLNGIIFVLTASSGMFSSSGSGTGSSDFYTNLLGKMESSSKQSSEALMEDLSAGISCTKLTEKVHYRSSPALVVEVPTLCMHRPCAVFDAHGTCQAEKGTFCSPPRVEVAVEEEEEEEEEEEGEQEGELEEAEEADSFKFSRLAMESRSFSFSCAESRIIEEEGNDNEDENVDGWWQPSQTHSRPAMVNKRLSFFCREEGDYARLMNSRSVPASRQLATPPKANSIKRSLSVDSASLQGDRPASLPSAESLSDEAFKRRVEEFISRMNAQIRNEAK